MNLEIRPARSEDAEGMTAVLNPIIEAGIYTVFDTPFSVEQERRYIEAFPGRGVLHVAVRSSDQRLVGFQSVEPFAAYTHAFDHVGVIGTYVELACRRQRVGSRLFKATFQAARHNGFSKLFTFIRADNKGALATYRSQGFEAVGTARKHARIRGRHVDEIIVERFL